MQSEIPLGAEPQQSSLKRRLTAELVALCKPRVIELLITTALPAMFLAARGIPELSPIIGVMIGGSLAAGSANAMNSIIEKDTDSRMHRTSHRPMPNNRLEKKSAWFFAIATQAVALSLIFFLANWVAALYTLAATLTYVFIYTIWLKPRTDQNIVIGGAAGAFPAVIGYSAITGYAPWQAWVMFTIIFLWTPAHFWALAVFHEKDYKLGGFPMLPITRGLKSASNWILYYTIATIFASLVLIADPDLRMIYPIVSIIAGVWFLYEAMILSLKQPELHRSRYMRFFHISNAYLALLFIAIAVDAMI